MNQVLLSCSTTGFIYLTNNKYNFKYNVIFIIANDKTLNNSEQFFTCATDVAELIFH